MKRVLVVISDDTARQACCKQIEEMGYRALEASGGRAAFRQAAMLKPHLILLDLPLADSTLSDFLGKLSGAERTAGIPLLARISDASATEGQDSRLAGILENNGDQVELKSRLDELLIKQAADL
jgi:CheY-like chemotaxis protein